MSSALERDSHDRPAPDGDEVRFLDDVRVVEVANLAPTQLGMHLADLGAEVVKIEPPTKGDATRLIELQPGFNDSGMHRRWNRGKRSIAVDMTTPAGLQIFCDLVRTADVLIEGLRPGTIEKMGIGWPELTALKPNVVMISVSGYGYEGPYRDMPSHGVGYDALAGLAPPGVDDRGRPRFPSPRINLGTIFAPLVGTGAVLAALSWSRRTGRPVFLDVAQADAAAYASMALEDRASQRRRAANGHAAAPAPAAPAGDSATMQYYRTRDGKVLFVMALERKFFLRLIETIGRPDLVGHFPADRYTNMLRGNDEVRDALTAAIATRDLHEWMEIFARDDIPVTPVHEGDDVLDDAQLASRLEWLPADQDTVTMRSPVHARPRLAPPSQAPAIGQHTDEILSELGIAQTDVDELVRSGVVRRAARGGAG